MDGARWEGSESGGPWRASDWAPQRDKNRTGAAYGAPGRACCAASPLSPLLVCLIFFQHHQQPPLNMYKYSCACSACVVCLCSLLWRARPLCRLRKSGLTCLSVCVPCHSCLAPRLLPRCSRHLVAASSIGREGGAGTSGCEDGAGVGAAVPRLGSMSEARRSGAVPPQFDTTGVGCEEVLRRRLEARLRSGDGGAARRSGAAQGEAARCRRARGRTV